MCSSCENYKEERRTLAPDKPVGSRKIKKVASKPWVIEVLWKWSYMRRRDHVRKWEVYKRYETRAGRDQAFETLQRRDTQYAEYRIRDDA